MWWNVKNLSWVWDDFSQTNIVNTTRQYPGDQDYLNAVLGLLSPSRRRLQKN
jgi:hypothetical protein